MTAVFAHDAAELALTDGRTAEWVPSSTTTTRSPHGLLGQVEAGLDSPRWSVMTPNSSTVEGPPGPPGPPGTPSGSTRVLPVVEYIERCLLAVPTGGVRLAGTMEATRVGVIDFIEAVSATSTIFPSVAFDDVVVVEWLASPHHLIVEFDSHGPISFGYFVDSDLATWLEDSGRMRSAAEPILRAMTAHVLDSNPNWRSHIRTP